MLLGGGGGGGGRLKPSHRNIRCGIENHDNVPVSNDGRLLLLP